MDNRTLTFLALGFLMVFSGFVFYFQGLGEFGPQSSFMHRSPDWVAYGQAISALGVVLISLSVISCR